MSDYIKRNDAKKICEEYEDEPLGDSELEAGTIKALIDCLPPADVVEVVRCKDCRYYKEYVSHVGSAMMCFCPCSIGGQGKKKPDDYCSYGERDEYTLKLKLGDHTETFTGKHSEGIDWSKKDGESDE